MKLVLTAKLTMQGANERTLLIGPATQVAFEREFEVPFANLFEELEMTKLYWVVWDAAKRQKIVERGIEFETFLEEVEDFDMDMGGDEEDPTSADQPE